MSEQKNKGGRPSNAELAARGMTKTEFQAGLNILKKIFGPSIDKMIELSDSDELSVKDQFRMKQELANMYIALVKSDHQLRIQLSRKDGLPDESGEDKPLAPVFAFARV
ncbi:hypothetical protein D3C80_345600 [compost metagenome]